MSGIPDDPTRTHPEKPGEFPTKSVNGHDRTERDKAAKADDKKKPEDKQEDDPKH
jgi:hypothetical protein